MASLFKIGDRWAIEVYKRGRIMVGHNRRTAQAVLDRVQRLEECRKFGLPVPGDLRSWLSDVDPEVSRRLHALGLVVDGAGRTIADLVALSEREGAIKARTRRNDQQATESLERFIGGDYLLADFREAEAIGYKRWLLESGRKSGGGLSPATVSRRIKRIRSLFARAIELGWVSANPLAKVQAGSQANESRAFFVDATVSRRIMEDLPKLEHRLAFALGRWGGLRIPSELLVLRWRDVDFATSSISVRSVKTEHHDGKGWRTCPLFPELRPILEEARDLAEPGEEWLFPETRQLKNPRQILAKGLEASLRRLGVERWPRLFSNLRATRSTEVASRFGMKAESEWIGHGVDVALRHYLTVTADDWKRATEQNLPE